MRTCKNCNNQIEDDASFCSECGVELISDKSNKLNSDKSNSDFNYYSTMNYSSPKERMYAQQEIVAKQQGKNYRRRRVINRILSRVVSFLILMAIFYFLSTIYT